MPILTRQVTINDLDAVYTFVCGLEGEHFDKSIFRRCFEANMGKEHYRYLLATIGNTPIGYISCHGQILLHHNGLVYEIQEMYVMPEYRNKGVGKLLLDALIAVISKDDYVLLEVCSSFKRVDAHRFYEANGFEKATYKFKKPPQLNS